MSITSLIKNAGVFPYAKKIIIHRANLQLQKYFCEELLKLLSNDETISVTRRTTRPLIRKLISTKKLKKHNNGSVAEKVPMELSLSLSPLFHFLRLPLSEHEKSFHFHAKAHRA